MGERKVAAFFAVSSAALFAAAVAVAEPNSVATVPLSAISNASSDDPRFDRNGRFAAFDSSAENLVVGQSTSGQRNVYLFDRLTGQVRLVSHAADDPLRGGNSGASGAAASQISADGNWVAFVSTSTDLVAGQDDTNSTNDVFLWSRQTGTTLLVSRRAGSIAGTGLLNSTLPTLQTRPRRGLRRLSAPAFPARRQPARFRQFSQWHAGDLRRRQVRGSDFERRQSRRCQLGWQRR